ncbi:hypothetical protein D187_000793 [Cystobacter fuscus DSM 2262]|uniref:Uncharacterized protein n=1 Tax=Cystobacter fuscus (strain ATCC 25194 / DSM 2262 / NBRC 100088 / M29) TaxID=1242864 RepID=S9PS62_CYSF2|nr:hypothetical protein D187_000793 [Cystobacter fuscus DSM 2262]
MSQRGAASRTVHLMGREPGACGGLQVSRGTLVESPRFWTWFAGTVLPDRCPGRERLSLNREGVGGGGRAAVSRRPRTLSGHTAWCGPCPVSSGGWEWAVWLAFRFCIASPLKRFGSSGGMVSHMSSRAISMTSKPTLPTESSPPSTRVTKRTPGSTVRPSPRPRPSFRQIGGEHYLAVYYRNINHRAMFPFSLVERLHARRKRRAEGGLEE